MVATAEGGMKISVNEETNNEKKIKTKKIKIKYNFIGLS